VAENLLGNSPGDEDSPGTIKRFNNCLYSALIALGKNTIDAFMSVEIFGESNDFGETSVNQKMTKSDFNCVQPGMS